MLGVALAALSVQSATASAEAVALPDCTPAPATCAGWHTMSVVLRWDKFNEDQSSGCDTATISEDGAHPSTCIVHDALGWHPFSVTVHIDKSAPTATGASTSRAADANGWFNHPVDVGFAGTDAVSGVATCTSLTYAGPDSGAAAMSGTCTDHAGNRSAATPFTLKYDSTAPDVTGASPTRKPDHDGWFNHPVGLRVSGTDGLSGVVACGPGAITTALVVASCSDRAGNIGSRGFGFRYDATPPTLRASAEPADARAYVRWRARGARRIRVVRTPGEHGARRSVVFRGRGHGLSDGGLRNGRRYRYTITAVDQAANATTRTVHVVPGPRVLAPRPGADLSAPPVLRWTRVRHTRYYNVQLFRVGRRHSVKLLSAWPRHAHLRLGASWRYAGRRRTLGPGRYRWFVWPGIGAPTERRFGTLVGRGVFRITAPPA